MVLQAAIGMTYYHFPLEDATQDEIVSIVSSYTWLAIEQLVFTSLLISNMVFLCLRSQVRHKLKLDLLDQKKRLPNIDTIIAIQEVVQAFNA